MVRSLLFLLFITSIGFNSYGQDSLVDNNKKDNKWADYEHKPKRAALWSLFPGAGQIYNEVGYRRIPQKKHRAWWKVPLIWGGIGVCTYYAIDNYRQAGFLKEEILYRRENGDSSWLHSHLYDFKSEFQLINGYTDTNDIDIPGFDLRAKRRIIFTAATLGVFALAMIEAYVDAHFVTFDVSDDLGMRVMPTMFDYKTPGVSIRFNFL